ncbi:3-methyladenine DNA glycosylase [Janibacter corallicola]|uniref:3-methyladenine DNA glycosylase n=1 Tax=Janibacter corallicola TaxID=415212 RepID=UPI000832E3D4|nr:3-methyladenine DNA glycosylase [Janibacter corallicola]
MDSPTETLLGREQWQELAREHAAAVDGLTAGRLERRRRGERHPVEDFLFEYYNHPPAKLRRWHPGPGVRLADAAEPYGDRSGYVLAADGSAVLDSAAFLERRGRAVTFVRDLLEATLSRPGTHDCFGLHEWAMVHRLAPGEQRHEQLPLRLGQAGTDEVVEGHRIRCSHFDAYRFFTEAAAPRNTLRPTRETQLEHEQPACLHAGMDVYKWAFKLAPAVPSELTLAAFRHALRVRELDMAASPYDLSDLGIAPVAIETATGKAEYVTRQRELMVASNALRRRLLAVIEDLRVAAGLPHVVGGR